MVEVKINKATVKKINKKLLESLDNYRKFVSYMAGDMPIEAMCLNKTIEKVLLKNGIVRVYDLFDRDLTKIKGIGKVRGRNLNTCLEQFLSLR